MFHYEKLDSRASSLRLIELLPGSDREPIRITLHHTAFEHDNTPEYFALSYTWGSEPQRPAVMIYCNECPFEVGYNLWSFLCQYRRTGSLGYRLWVDAICIDQENILERNHQVAQMRTVYSKARSVIVWLGPDINTGNADLVFDFVSREPGLDSHGLSGRVNWNRLRVEWRSLASLLDRPYWNRVWIIQEIILAKNVSIWCGHRSEPLNKFYDICLFLKTYRYDLDGNQFLTLAAMYQSQGYAVLMHRAEWHNSDHPRKAFTLRKLFRQYANSRSSDTRDRVYALLGIASDVTETAPLYPDYAKTAAEVFLDVLRHQDQWSQMRREHDHSLVSSLRQLLRVTHRDLAVQISQHEPDLRPYLLDIAATKLMCAEFDQIGTVVDVVRLYSSMTVEAWVESASITRSPRQAVKDAVSSLTSIHDDSRLVQLLGYSFSHHAFGKLLPEPSESDHLDPLQPWTEKVGKIPLRFIRRDMCTPTTSTTDNVLVDVDTVLLTDDLDVRTPRTIFIGSNDLIGITSGSVQPNDLICVSARKQITSSAIIVRTIGTFEQSKQKSIVSTAMIKRQCPPVQNAFTPPPRDQHIKFGLYFKSSHLHELMYHDIVHDAFNTYGPNHPIEPTGYTLRLPDKLSKRSFDSLAGH